MDAVIRGLVVYLFLMLIFKIAGKRSLSQITIFDFVMLLIISETTQQALLTDDFSVTNAFILITTLMGADMIMSYVQSKFHKIDKFVDGLPTILMDNGKLLNEAMNKSRVEEKDILEAARKIHGLERMEQINYAILEKDGTISIIPKGST